jgi:hypothetical protein
VGLNWEDIDNYHRRAKVFGGWLVKTFEDVHRTDKFEPTGYDWRVAMAFVPDPNHEWELK